MDNTRGCLLEIRRMATTAATALYPFVPSGSDFDAARAFLGELGFRPEWEQPDYVGLRFGGAFFILQRIDVPLWQQNQQVVFEVPDLDGYWRELEAKRLPQRFQGVAVKPPTDYPWGREIHVIDPGGVCWHVRQTEPR